MTEKITGLMIYYNIVCDRKLWYFYHDLNMESNHENVAIGKAIEKYSYLNENKHLNINNIINIDYLEKEHLIHEIKKSKAIEEASIWQVKYYIYYLKSLNVKGVKGRIDYPLLRQSISVNLSDKDSKTIEKMIDEIIYKIKSEVPPIEKKKAICSKCAYFELCWI